MSKNFHYDGIAGAAAGRLALRDIDALNKLFEVDPPATLTDQLNTLEQNRLAIFEEIQSQTTLVDLVHRALETGEPLLEHTGPIAAATYRNAINLTSAVKEGHEQRARAIVAEALPALFQLWKKPVADCGKAIAAAKKALPGVALRDPAAAAQMTPQEFKLFAPGHAALKTLDKATPHLAGAMNLSVGVPQPNRRQLMLAALTLDQLAELGKGGKKLEDLDNLTISLATPEEFLIRRDAINDQIQAVSDAYDEKMAGQLKEDTATPFNESARRGLENMRRR